MNEPVISSDRPPDVPSRLVDDFAPPLILDGEHNLCPGCGEPIAIRSAVELVAELRPHGENDRGVRDRLLHGIRGRSSTSRWSRHSTAARRRSRPGSSARSPTSFVFTVQGDGDMVNEGLQELMHTAARGERVTAILLNNGVFGETGGHMTATTVIGQRTKNSLDGRDAALHGYPIPIADILVEARRARHSSHGAR